MMLLRLLTLPFRLLLSCVVALVAGWCAFAAVAAIVLVQRTLTDFGIIE